MTTPPVIIPADPAARTRALWVALVLALALGAGLLLAQERIEAIERLALLDGPLARQAMLRLLDVLAWANAAVSACLAGYFLWLGHHTFHSGRFPPPNLRPIRATRLRQGRSAQALGVLMAVAGLAFLSTNLLVWNLRNYVKTMLLP